MSQPLMVTQYHYPIECNILYVEQAYKSTFSMSPKRPITQTGVRVGRPSTYGSPPPPVPAFAIEQL